MQVSIGDMTILFLRVTLFRLNGSSNFQVFELIHVSFAVPINAA
jgi:hypothetical protein